MVDILPTSTNEFLRVNLKFEMFEKCTLIWFHLNKNGQKVVKNQRIRSLKKKWPVEMVEKFLSNKFGVNPLDGFRENEYYTQTADARVTTVVLLAVEQSRATL